MVPEEGSWRIEVRPYGGAHMSTSFSPHALSGRSAPGAADLILAAVKRTAGQIGKIKDRMTLHSPVFYESKSGLAWTE